MQLTLTTSVISVQQFIFIRAAPHVSVRMLLYFTAVIFFNFFFISASLISAVSPPIWLKFGTLAGSWCNL